MPLNHNHDEITKLIQLGIYMYLVIKSGSKKETIFIIGECFYLGYTINTCNVHYTCMSDDAFSVKKYKFNY